jgi:CHAT domain-containing protein
MQTATAAYQGGDYSAAEIALKQGIEEAEKFGSTDERLATSLHNLAILYHAQGRLAEATPRYQRALGIWETLAKKHLDQNHAAETEELYRRLLTVKEKIYGPEHLEVATSLDSLALMYMIQGRYAEAEPLYQRALATRKKVLGSDHLEVAMSLNNLAVVYLARGQYADAEARYKSALMIKEKALGREHPDMAVGLDNLAGVYLAQGRYAEAKPLYQRALEIKEKTLGPEHLDVATSLNNLARLYWVGWALPTLHMKALPKSCQDLARLYQDHLAGAEQLYQRALRIWEKTVGAGHPFMAVGLDNLAFIYLDLASVYLDLDCHTESEDLFKRAEDYFKHALEIEEKTYGPEHPNVAESQCHLANLYRLQSRTAAAEPLYQRALAIEEKVYGPEHLAVAESLGNLALVYNQQGRTEEALAAMRRATVILRKRLVQGMQSVSAGTLSEQRIYHASLFRDQVAILADAAIRQFTQAPTLWEESFEAAQLAHASDTARAVATMAARFAAGKDELAELVRQRQDALARWQALDKQWRKAISEPAEKHDPEREERLHQEIVTTEQELVMRDSELRKRFPKYYQDFISPELLSLQEVQNLIDPDESLLSYLVGDKASYLWVVRANQVQFLSLPIDKANLDKQVQQLRSDLQQLRPPKLVQHAHELYSKLFAPAEPFLQGVTHIMLVLDGALQSLPFSILVTEKPIGRSENPAAYREVTWLTKKYAFTVLPTESSLRALRCFATAEVGKEPFVGFGNPLRVKPLLPETADELKQIAKALGAPTQENVNIFLGEAATKNTVIKNKKIDLSHYRVLAFATHAIEAGDCPGVAEPALVLTPPAQKSQCDPDGLLTASEVAQLKLNADWVILSACNTAASDGTPGAEVLSGLAKAFFYAGSRALLVSHWEVDSDSTVKLTTGMFKEAAANPTLSKAETLRRSMVTLMNNPGPSLNLAHPTYWAPFVVVGGRKAINAARCAHGP